MKKKDNFSMYKITKRANPEEGPHGPIQNIEKLRFIKKVNLRNPKVME